MHVEISISKQRLQLYESKNTIAEYSISSSKYGVGQESGSFKTPTGEHVIRAKIGDGCALNSVFVARRFTEEIYSEQLGLQSPERDWILTRILWLSGCEKGKNRSGSEDSMRRYIYIHGTPDSEPMGEPASHGCIRMRNEDVADLYGRVSVGCSVFISAPIG